jgi:ABC-type dipeptide/oligopeptide/nickel transport system ATPase component
VPGQRTERLVDRHGFHGEIGFRGLSLLYITHDLLSARVVTDELLVLNKGRVVDTGPTKQVLRHPRNAYTKELLAAPPNPVAHAAAAPGTT